MDITKSDRATLKSYFVKNAVPTAGHFADLIDGMINQKEDGIAKLPGEPLSLQAHGDDTSQKKAINFYRNFTDPNPAWTMSLNPRADPNNPATAKAGWSIGDAAGASKLFIDQNTGNTGIGTVTPAERLDVNGRTKSGSLTVGAWPANPAYMFFGINTLNQAAPGNYALLQGTSDGPGRTFLNSPVDIRFRIANADQMVLTNNGSVGIGTTAPAARLEVNGAAVIGNGNTFAAKNNHMAPGSLTVGSTTASYGGGSSWNANTAGLLLETLANTEIAVHDSGTRIASLMYYEGDATNRITIGRDMAWGAIGQVVLNGNVGIGTQTPAKKLDVNGDIQMGAARTFSSPGRMHITGDELLYLLHKNGVIVGKEWGGNGNLQVQGTLTARSMRVTRYAASVTVNVTLSTVNTWGDFPQLTVPFTLAQEADVMVFYGISMNSAAAAGHLCTRLVLDNVEQPQARSIAGNTQYWSPSSLWTGVLAAGSHTFKVQYRTPHGGVLNPGSDWEKGSLLVTVYGAG